MTYPYVCELGITLPLRFYNPLKYLKKPVSQRLEVLGELFKVKTREHVFFNQNSPLFSLLKVLFLVLHNYFMHLLFRIVKTRIVRKFVPILGNVHIQSINKNVNSIKLIILWF